MNRNSFSFFGMARLASAAALTLVLAACGNGGAPPALFTQTDAATGNEIVRFSLAGDGRMTEAGRFATGGLGSGTLAQEDDQNQNSVVIRDGYLYAVNAGGNPSEGSVSVFRLTRDGLQRVGVYPSGGTRPNSVAVSGSLLYVLNRVSANIVGFRIGNGGVLTQIPNSTRALAGGTASVPPQIEFTPNGSALVVTERKTQLIDTFIVDRNTGLAGQAISNPSNGVEPFGFAFNSAGVLVVSEGFFGAEAQGTASSYQVAANGSLQTISATVANSTEKPCWVVITRDGRTAFVQSAGSQLASYAVDASGRLTLLQSLAATTNTDKGGLDLILDRNDGFLFANNSATGISVFRVGTNGALTLVPGAANTLPPTAVGLAVN